MKTTLSLLALSVILFTGGSAIAAGGGGVVADPGAMQGKHFDPKGKAPSTFTVEL
jgi:hypothetical protein